jgi:hypothetical protein
LRELRIWEGSLGVIGCLKSYTCLLLSHLATPQTTTNPERPYIKQELSSKDLAYLNKSIGIIPLCPRDNGLPRNRGVVYTEEVRVGVLDRFGKGNPPPIVRGFGLGEDETRPRVFDKGGEVEFCKSVYICRCCSAEDEGVSW